jgi:hypothetical protein
MFKTFEQARELSELLQQWVDYKRQSEYFSSATGLIHLR